MKKRSLLVITLIASILLYGFATVLTRVEAVSSYSVTVNWTPAVTGLLFVNVDGTNYTSPQTFSWAYGSQHNITAYIPVIDGIKGKIYIFANWTDTAALAPLPTNSSSFIYTVVGADTVTAFFKWFWAGDLNFDGVVNILDAIIFASAFLSTPGMPNWDVYADCHHDGIIDILDAIILASNFGQTSPYTSF